MRCRIQIMAIGSDGAVVGFFSVGIQRKPTKFGSDLIRFYRVPLNSDEIRRGSDRKRSNLPVGLVLLGSKELLFNEQREK